MEKSEKKKAVTVFFLSTKERCGQIYFFYFEVTILKSCPSTLDCKAGIFNFFSLLNTLTVLLPVDN